MTHPRCILAGDFKQLLLPLTQMELREALSQLLVATGVIPKTAYETYIDATEGS